MSVCLSVCPHAGHLRGPHQRTRQEVHTHIANGWLDASMPCAHHTHTHTQNRVPSVESAGIQHTVCGPERYPIHLTHTHTHTHVSVCTCCTHSFTPDHKPLVGYTPDCENLFLACGYNSAGRSVCHVMILCSRVVVLCPCLCHSLSVGLWCICYRDHAEWRPWRSDCPVDRPGIHRHRHVLTHTDTHRHTQTQTHTHTDRLTDRMPSVCAGIRQTSPGSTSRTPTTPSGSRTGPTRPTPRTTRWCTLTTSLSLDGRHTHIHTHIHSHAITHRSVCSCVCRLLRKSPFYDRLIQQARTHHTHTEIEIEIEIEREGGREICGRM